MSDPSVLDAPVSADTRLLLPVSEVAGLLGLSKMTIYRRIRSGAWPSGRCGRKHLIPHAFIAGLISEIAAGRQVVAEEYAAVAWPTRTAGAVPTSVKHRANEVVA